MLNRQRAQAAVPSRHALHVIRQLALTSSYSSGGTVYDGQKWLRRAGRPCTFHSAYRSCHNGATLNKEAETEAESPSTANVSVSTNGTREVIGTTKNRFDLANAIPKTSSDVAMREESMDNTVGLIARQRLSKFRLKYADGEHAVPLTVRIHRLLEQGKIIEATQNFLDIYAMSTNYAHYSRREAAITLFYANLKEENIYLAKTLFHWIEEHQNITPSLWELMLLALGKRRNIEALAELYISYATLFQLPTNLSAIVLRSLVDSFRLDAAKNFIFNYLDRDLGCGLCSVYLHGLWKKTKNVELMEVQFQRLVFELHRRGKPVTEKLFDPLLKAYIEFQYDERAAMLVDEMTNKYQLPLLLRTRGLLAFGKALKCDWEGVEDDICDLFTSGLSKSNPHMFAKVFHRIFLEYWLANSGQKIYSFFFKAVEEYGLIPDRVLFDRVVKAFIEKGDPQMIDHLLRTAEERHWNLGLDRETFFESLREHRLSTEISPSGLWRMFRAMEHKHGYAVASHRILGYDRMSFPIDEAYKVPWTHEATKWWKNALAVTEPSKPLNQFSPLHRQMIHFIQAGKPGQALALYRTAKEAGKVMKRIDVELAVTASILANEDLSLAKDILEEEFALSSFGKPVTPLYFQQVLGADSLRGADALKLAVLNFYALLERRFLPFKHHVSASVGANLIRKGEPRTALELFREVYRSRFGAIEPFDSVTVKILARAFAASGNLLGIRWAIFTALARPSGLDRTVLVEILCLLEALRSRTPAPSRRFTSADFHAYIGHLSSLAEVLASRFGARGQEPADSSDITSSPSDNDVAASYPIENISLDQTDLVRDSESMLAIIESWRERAELERCLRSDSLLQTGEGAYAAMGQSLDAKLDMAEHDWDELTQLEEEDRPAEMYADK